MRDRLRRLRATATVLAAMVAMLAMTVTAAFAVYPPDEDFGVACTPTNPQPGDTVSCEVTGAQDGEDLEATASGDVAGVFYEDALVADDQGRATFAFGTDDLSEGEAVTVSVRGAESGETGTEVTVEAAEDDEATDEDEVTDEDDEVVTDDGERIAADDVADADTDRLPVTGGQVLLLSVLGVSLLGGGLLALRRRGTVA